MTRIYVIMGRAGDFLSQAPFLHAEYVKTGQKQKVMIAREFAPLLDGFSYIDRVIFEGEYRELEKAVLMARGMADQVIVTSLHGTPAALEKYVYSQVKSKHAVCPNFQLEAWNLAGHYNSWDLNLPLVIDQRDKEREERLLRANGFRQKGKKKPVILYFLGGYTCAFPYSDTLLDYLKCRFGQSHRILELPMVEKPNGRFYDLLGIMEESSLLISADTQALHLAWACPQLPVFALANDKPSYWLGSNWMPNQLWYCRYRDWPKRALEMMDAISEVDLTPARHIRVWQEYQYTMPGWPACRDLLPVKTGMLSLDSSSRFPNEQRFPYLKDVVKIGLRKAESDELPVAVQRHSEAELFTGPDIYYRYTVKDGIFVPIVNTFVARKRIWREMLDKIPNDLIMADDPAWPQALLAIFKAHGAVDLTVEDK